MESRAYGPVKAPLLAALSPCETGMLGACYRTWGTRLRNFLQSIPIVALLLIATVLEVSGDAIVRKALYSQTGLARFGLFAVGAALLLGYGTFLNLAPLE